MQIIESDIYIKHHNKIKDHKALWAIARRRDAIIHKDHFGDCKNLGDGISELRIDEGAGYRIYYHIKDGKVYFLRGGDKSRQQQDINELKKILPQLLKNIDRGASR
jgi:putative addiction module killer protein